MLSAITLAVLLVWIEKIIYGNIQQGDELIKSIEAGVLSSVFKIHDRARGAVYKLCEVFLCPAFGFSFALDFPAQRVKIKLVIYKRGFNSLRFSYMMKGTGLT